MNKCGFIILLKEVRTIHDMSQSNIYWFIISNESYLHNKIQYQIMIEIHIQIRIQIDILGL